MLVSKDDFPLIMERLMKEPEMSLDTETTGLRMYHGDHLFSIIIGTYTQAYYFNFNDKPDHLGGYTPNALPREYLAQFKPLLQRKNVLWYLANAKFDQRILAQEDLFIEGDIHCTVGIGRVDRNDLHSYSLEKLLPTIGMEKDATVENYIDEHGLKTKVPRPGRVKPDELLHYDQVPGDLIVPYGLRDAEGTLKLGRHQVKSIENQAKLFPPGQRNVRDIMLNERKFTQVIFKMEHLGVKIDRKYCDEGLAFERDRQETLKAQFKEITGLDFKDSSKVYAQAFLDDKDKWEYTEKGNPSFATDVIEYFTSPAARTVMALRGAKSKADFFAGFLFHADKNDIIHPTFNTGGAKTGRLSSSEPNLQNLTSEAVQVCLSCGEEHETFVSVCGASIADGKKCQSTSFDFPQYLTRRAIIPRPGYCFFMPDYDQMEYKQMLDLAKEMMIQFLLTRGITTWGKDYFRVADDVANGYDVHEATARLAGITRKQAKTLNFALLYGAGIAKLAIMLGVSLQEAAELKARYFAALPYIEHMINQVRSTASTRGWVRNWAGRKYNFNSNTSFKSPNAIIQGGCADVMKIAMIEIDEMLEQYKSRMVLTIHDELPSEIHESEMDTVPRMIKEKMESVYPIRHVKLTAGAEWSPKSLGDKYKGYPGEKVA